MKKGLRIILLAGMIWLLAYTAAAADTVLYVRDGGSGDGTRAEAPLGDLQAALTAAESGGTIVFCGPYTVSEKFVAPKNTAPILLTAVYGGTDYAKTTDAELRLAASYFCGGETVFRDLHIVNTENNLGIYGYYSKLTMDDGLVCTYAGNATGYLSVLGGGSVAKRGACDLTIRSGTWYRVRGGSSTAGSGQAYDITVTVSGGKIIDRLYGGPQGSYSGNMSLTVSGGELQNGITALIPTDAASVLAADIAVTVSGGRIGGSIDATVNPALGIYESGSYALNLSGGDFTHLSAVSGCPRYKDNTLYLDTPTLPDTAVVGDISFGNMLRTNGADPWLFMHENNYYYIATGGSTLTLYRAANLGDLSTATGKVIYRPESGKAWSVHLWSPEIHYFSESDVGAAAAGWYCFVGGASGETDETGSINSGQRAYVIKCLDGDNLLGRWGHPITGEVNVPQIVTFPDSDYNDASLCGGCSVIRIGGKPYITFVSELGRGTADFHQVICIAEFENPWTVVGTPTVICAPTYDWEAGGYGYAGLDANGNERWYPKVVEGATAVYGADGSIFIAYAASGYWTPYYCLGQLTYSGNDPLSAASWTKRATPILQKSDALCGTGHASYLTDQSGNRWICYHAYRGTTTTNEDGTRKARNAFIEPYSASAETGIVIGNGSTYAATPDTVFTVPLNSTPLAEKATDFGTVVKTTLQTTGTRYADLADRIGSDAFALYTVTESGNGSQSTYSVTLPAAESRLLFRMRGAFITPISPLADEDGKIRVSALAGDSYVFADAPFVCYGDVTGDGEISLADAILILRFAAGHAIEGSFDTAAADLDGNAVVTPRDCLLTLRKLP